MPLPRTKYHVLLLLASIAVGGLASAQPVAAAVRTAPSDLTHPLVMKEAADRLAIAPPQHLPAFIRPAAVSTIPPSRPSREVFGFALTSSLTDPSVGYTTWNFSVLTTVAVFGLHVQDDGTFANDSGASVWNSSQLTGLVNTAHMHGTKVLLTIILQDFSSGTPHMCAGLAHAQTTISQTLAQVGGKGVDGVDVDYEGLNGACGTGDSSWARHAFTNMVLSLRSQLGGGDLVVDTYASSASDPRGFFDVGAQAPAVDEFFVMAYDLDYSNYTHAPTNCGSYCLNPTAPLAGYYYNDTSTVSQYLGVVAPSKVLLGVPYYGRKACVGSSAPNQTPTGPVAADTYLDATGEATDPAVQPGSYQTHRDANDPAGQERWDTWVNTSMNCTRELYWDDVTSLGPKYDLVNSNNLRGVGIWNLNYGGGASELWQLLQSKFETQWATLGGTLSSGPGVASWGPNRIDLFARDNNNALIHSWWNGAAYSGWESLGGVITSDPAAVSWGPNRIDVFARGQDNALWHKWWNGTSWSGWSSLGGVLSSSPGASSWSSGRLDVFAKGQDNALWHRWWDGTSWGGWQSLGGSLTSDAAAVSWTAYRIDVFARGADNGLWHLAWGGSGWSQWQSLGGMLTSGPDTSSCGTGHLDVFVLGGSSSLFQLGWTGTYWTGWIGLGGQWTSDPGAICLGGAQQAQLFERGSDNALWRSSVLAS